MCIRDSPETRQNEFNDYDNSFLIMLFGVIGCVLLLKAVVLWLRNIRAARAVDCLLYTSRCV